MLRPVLLSLAVSAPLLAQDIQPVVEVGDDVPGYGEVFEIGLYSVNEESWLVKVNDYAYIRDGALYLKLGDPIGSSGFSAVGFPNAQMGPSGDIAISFPFFATPARLFHELTFVAEQGDESFAPGFDPGFFYTSFRQPEPNGLGGVTVLASLTKIPASFASALMNLVALPGGGIASETVLVKTGDVLPGQTKAIDKFDDEPQVFDFNESGDLIFVASLTPIGPNDEVIYFNDTLVAQTGSPSPIGNPWLSLTSQSTVDLNSSGDYVIRGNVEVATAYQFVIAKNGAELVVAQGDVLPDIAPHELTTIHHGPLFITDAGDVVWHGSWAGLPGQSSGIFLNEELILQQGVADVQGVLITELVASFDVSPGGRLMFTAVLEDGSEGVYLVDLADFVPSAVTPMSECFGNHGTLSHVAGEPSPGATLGLELDDAQALGAFAFLGIDAAPFPGWPACGLALPGIGELLIDLSGSGPFVKIPDQPTWEGAALPIDLNFSTGSGLLGVELFTQGLFLDVAPGATEPLRLTGGLALTLGI